MCYFGKMAVCFRKGAMLLLLMYAMQFYVKTVTFLSDIHFTTASLFLVLSVHVGWACVNA